VTLTDKHPELVCQLASTITTNQLSAQCTAHVYAWGSATTLPDKHYDIILASDGLYSCETAGMCMSMSMGV
jgi:hypothetical protein